MPKPRHSKQYWFMKKMESVKYEAPEVEVLEVMVEKGFEISQLEKPEYGGTV